MSQAIRWPVFSCPVCRKVPFSADNALMEIILITFPWALACRNVSAVDSHDSRKAVGCQYSSMPEVTACLNLWGFEIIDPAPDQRIFFIWWEGMTQGRAPCVLRRDSQMHGSRRSGRRSLRFCLLIFQSMIRPRNNEVSRIPIPISTRWEIYTLSSPGFFLVL